MKKLLSMFLFGAFLVPMLFLAFFIFGAPLDRKHVGIGMYSNLCDGASFVSDVIATDPASVGYLDYVFSAFLQLLPALAGCFACMFIYFWFVDFVSLKDKLLLGIISIFVVYKFPYLGFGEKEKGCPNPTSDVPWLLDWSLLALYAMAHLSVPFIIAKYYKPKVL